jgi:hypothetical protein
MWRGFARSHATHGQGVQPTTSLEILGLPGPVRADRSIAQPVASGRPDRHYTLAISAPLVSELLHAFHTSLHVKLYIPYLKA